MRWGRSIAVLIVLGIAYVTVMRVSGGGDDANDAALKNRANRACANWRVAYIQVANGTTDTEDKLISQLETMVVTRMAPARSACATAVDRGA